MQDRHLELQRALTSQRRITPRYGFGFDQLGSGSPLPLPAGFSTGGVVVVAEPAPLEPLFVGVALPAPEPLSGVTVEAEPAAEPLPVGLLCGGVLTTTGATTSLASTDVVSLSSESCIVLGSIT